MSTTVDEEIGVPSATEEVDAGAGKGRGKRGKGPSGQRGSGGSGGAVYGLGVIGAAVWYWQQATTPQERAIGVLKAFVWPATLVYNAFKLLQG
jgi:hypothetical protein